MNKKQKKILEFLKDKDPTKYFSNEEISKETKISPSVIGSECYKMRSAGLLEHGPAQIGVELKNRITVLGQNQLDHEYDKKQNLGWMKKTTIATIGLLVVTGILAFGTIGLSSESIRQTELFQEDFDINNRPWIGFEKLDVFDDKIVLTTKNYGKIPNNSGTIIIKLTNYMFSKDEIRSSSNTDRLHVAMPDQILKSTLKSEQFDELMTNAKNGSWEVFLGVELDYSYSDNNSGNYGFIGKYNPESNKIDLLESWGT